MARRELSARWARRLGEGGASDSESLADKLATTGLEPGTLELDDVLLGPHRASVVDLLERVATFRTGVETQRECAAAIARIVSGLKTYAHLDAPEAERGDIHKGIEVALAVMAPRIPAGVEVVTRFGECRPIVHHPGALMQVWTNLLDNALRAMGDSGRLKIETTQASDMVVVSISDTGPGIPVELRDHIFELDVTTRGPGAGLGLGLPICKRIIKADHGGQITFETGAAGTTFEVRLPERG
jgi:signal transduction histidine kinase